MYIHEPNIKHSVPKYSFLLSTVSGSTSTTSKSYELAVILVSSLVPGLILLIILIVLLVLVAMKCRKKPSLLHTQTISDEEIVEYASTPITEVGKFTLAPPLPPSLQISQNLAYASTQFTASEANTYSNTSSGSGNGVEGDPTHKLDSDSHSDEVINDSYGTGISYK